MHSDDPRPAGGGNQHLAEAHDTAGEAGRPASDPTRLARQAIRAEGAARAYAERQLAYAQREVEQLRTKLFHERAAKEEAIRTAQSSLAIREAIERRLATMETALAEERTGRLRAERSLTDARAVIHDLDGRLAVAQRSLQAERDSRQKAEEALAAAARTETDASSSTALSSPVTQTSKPIRERSPKPTQPKAAARSRSKVVKWWVKG